MEHNPDSIRSLRVWVVHIDRAKIMELAQVALIDSGLVTETGGQIQRAENQADDRGETRAENRGSTNGGIRDKRKTRS